MPRLMEKKDWTRTISRFGVRDRVWQTVCNATGMSISLPEQGTYRVYFIKVDEKAKSTYDARDLIGYARKYDREPRTAESWLQEIREGDEN